MRHEIEVMEGLFGRQVGNSSIFSLKRNKRCPRHFHGLVVTNFEKLNLFYEGELKFHFEIQKQGRPLVIFTFDTTTTCKL